MSLPSVFDVRKQLTFYGAYHHNSTNIAIHELCVPLLLWSGLVLGSAIPTQGLFSPLHIELNPYLVFDLKFPFLYALVSMVFYFAMEPIAALLYTPQMVLTLLTATAFSYRPQALAIAGGLHVVSWIAQFVGHFGAEGRAPALVDNLLQAFLLAPFFVHFEILFMLGYKPELQKHLHLTVEAELARIHAMESEKKLKKGM